MVVCFSRAGENTARALLDGQRYLDVRAEPRQVFGTNFAAERPDQEQAAPTLGQLVGRRVVVPAETRSAVERGEVQLRPLAPQRDVDPARRVARDVADQGRRLEEKFTALVEPIRGRGRAADLLGEINRLDALKDVRGLMALCST